MENKEILKQFGKRLKERRKTANLTQAQLAELAGVSTNFIGMVERGERNIKYTNIYKIISALKSTIEEFFKKM